MRNAYRECAKTHKKYRVTDNIPFNKDNIAIDGIVLGNKMYKIINQHRKAEDAFYNGVFIGDNYAVALRIDNGFYQQISNWYMRYGDALKYLRKEIANDKLILSYEKYYREQCINKDGVVYEQATGKIPNEDILFALYILKYPIKINKCIVLKKSSERG